MHVPENTLRRYQRRLALHTLMMQSVGGVRIPTPDLPCLRDPKGRPRGHRWTVARDPKVDPDILKRDLGTAYVEHRRQDYGHDLSCVVRTYATPQLRIVRRISL
jgi:hypothetical protein